MEIVLSNEEARVLGSLIEKELSTPDYYPLSVNALKVMRFLQASDYGTAPRRRLRRMSCWLSPAAICRRHNAQAGAGSQQHREG